VAMMSGTNGVRERGAAVALAALPRLQLNRHLDPAHRLLRRQQALVRLKLKRPPNPIQFVERLGVAPRCRNHDCRQAGFHLVDPMPRMLAGAVSYRSALLST
jgi:hypothetical protein